MLSNDAHPFIPTGDIILVAHQAWFAFQIYVEIYSDRLSEYFEEDEEVWQFEEGSISHGPYNDELYVECPVAQYFPFRAYIRPKLHTVDGFLSLRWESSDDIPCTEPMYTSSVLSFLERGIPWHRARQGEAHLLSSLRRISPVERTMRGSDYLLTVELVLGDSLHLSRTF